MEHTKPRRALAALVAAGGLLLSACGSAETGSGTSPSSVAPAQSASPTAATGASTGEGTADPTTASSDGETSAPSSEPTSTGDPSASPTSATSPDSSGTETSGATVSSPSTEGSSQTSAGEGVSVTDAAGLTVLAQQLGCSDPEVKAAKPGSEGAKAGATAVAQCTLDGTSYLLAATKNPAGVPGLIKSFSAAIAGGKNVFYVVGPTWFALGSKTGEDAPEEIADAIQAKIGGEVKSTA